MIVSFNIYLKAKKGYATENDFEKDLTIHQVSIIDLIEKALYDSNVSVANSLVNRLIRSNKYHHIVLSNTGEPSGKQAIYHYSCTLTDAYSSGFTTDIKRREYMQQKFDIRCFLEDNGKRIMESLELSDTFDLCFIFASKCFD